MVMTTEAISYIAKEQTQRKGDWIQTFSGKAFYPMDPREEEILIIDIAHSLSMQCRFAGHCVNFYSVAEHCCHIYDSLEDIQHKAQGLLHDAAEAYILDIPRPLKPYLTNYKEIEKTIQDMIYKKYNLQTEMYAEVKNADFAILKAEASQNMVSPPLAWKDDGVEIMSVALQYWEPTRAKAEFMSRFIESQKIRKMM